MIDFDALVLGPCIATFGESVPFQPIAGPQIPLNGIWSEKYTEITFQDGNQVASTNPVLGCRESDFAGLLPVQNDIFLIRGRLWAINEVKPDGMGHLHLSMRLANDAQRLIPPALPAPT